MLLFGFIDLFILSVVAAGINKGVFTLMWIAAFQVLFGALVWPRGTLNS